MSDRCFVKEVINVCTLFSIYLCTILLKALYGHSLGFRWPPLRMARGGQRAPGHRRGGHRPPPSIQSEQVKTISTKRESY